jgi:stalled ribosome alternative rescue factor ArfA
VKGLRYTTQRRRVDFAGNVQDRAIKALIRNPHIPFTTKFVAKYTKSSKGQVAYRRKLLRKWTMADRRGKTQRARELIQRLDRMIAQCRKLRNGDLN